MIDWEFVTQPNLKKMISRNRYRNNVEIFEKTNDTKYSLSMKASKYEQIFKNNLYFIYVILKVALLEILFFPITIKRLFKKFKS